MRKARWFFSGGLAALLMLMAALPVKAGTTLTQAAGIDHVKAVAASGDLYTALRADGSVWVWFDDGTAMDGIKPQRIEISCRVRAVAPGPGLTALLCADGSVWTARMAINTKGMKAQQVQGLDSVRAVAMGRSALVALRTDGTVWVAEVAVSEGGVRPPNHLPGLDGVTAVAAGIDDFVTIKADGTAWTGLAINTKGTGATRVMGLPPVRGVAVCGGDEDCDGTDDYIYETADGHAVTLATGADGTAQVRAAGDLQCSACMAAGHQRFVAVTGAGDARTTVFTDDSGAVTVTDLPKPGPALKQVAAGRRYDMGLGADGTVWMWAAPTGFAQVQGLTGIKEIATAGEWSVALGADGRVWVWGSNPVNKPLVIPHVIESTPRGVKATFDFYLIVNTDGSVSAGTWPAAGRPPAEPVVLPGVTANSVSGGPRGHVIIMKFDGTAEDARVTVDSTGVHVTDPTPIAGLDGAVQVAAGDDGYLALRADGTVWGARAGEAPKPVADVAGARAVAGGGQAYAVLMGDGSVRTIAIDEQGAHVWGDPHVSEVDSLGAGGGGGAGGLLALRADGTVVTFSRTVGAGQVTEILGGIAVAAGTKGNLVLLADGTVWRWR